MKLVIFGLSISSSWGNGHATLWRGLCRALIARGHDVEFFERDVPYYAAHRDMIKMPGLGLHLYTSWNDISRDAARHLKEADVAMVTSYCPDALNAAEMMFSSSAGLKTFYDLDTGVTLNRLAAGERVDYIGARGLADFDLVFSYTGGQALQQLQNKLGARRVLPLYGSVDPRNHYPVEPADVFRADLSYLGTYAEDRQAALETLFVEAARRLPQARFVIGGAMYPAGFPWTKNIFFVHHLPPSDHPAFYCSSRLTLNVTRRPMADMGFCPSGRLFEAAACGVPIVSDWWEGLDQFFEPGREILIARTTDDVLHAIRHADLRSIGKQALDRALACHTAEIRAVEFETAVQASAAVEA
ncbi:MAG: glycosyltransferase [Acidobacteriaceae bacterium]|nr:glycosyltransferase [Acidobacteriaceae bacterium]